MNKFLLLLVSLWCFTSAVLAQEDVCLTLVEEALQVADSQCSQTARNQTCYGNIILEAEPQAGVADFNLEKPGDIEDISGLKTLRLSPLNLTDSEWGIALMRIQASLPDTMPGQNVTFLLFGDVGVENRVQNQLESSTLTAVARAGVNIRSQPSTEGAIVGSLAAGGSISADGRLADSSWLRVQLPDGKTGWVFAQLLRVEGEPESLNIIEPELSQYGPMQAFYFRSGVNDAPCAQAPDSGILIQTPVGAAKMTLSANEVKISLGSTIYVQAQAGNEMIVNTLDGSVQVTAFQVTRLVPAGTRVRVPLDDNLSASGPPSLPEPYDETRMQLLPVGNLDEEIQVRPALTQPEIMAALATPTPEPVAVTAGSWTITETLLEQSRADCEQRSSWTETVTFVPNADGAGFALYYSSGSVIPFAPVGNTKDTYLGSGFNRTYLLTFTSPGTFTGDVRHISADWICVGNQSHWRWDGRAS